MTDEVEVVKVPKQSVPEQDNDDGFVSDLKASSSDSSDAERLKEERQRNAYLAMELMRLQGQHKGLQSTLAQEIKFRRDVQGYAKKLEANLSQTRTALQGSQQQLYVERQYAAYSATFYQNALSFFSRSIPRQQVNAEGVRRPEISNASPAYFLNW